MKLVEKVRMREVVRKQKVKIISPEREGRKVKTRDESKKTNFMTERLVIHRRTIEKSLDEYRGERPHQRCNHIRVYGR